jgi:hypothetical protein
VTGKLRINPPSQDNQLFLIPCNKTWLTCWHLARTIYPLAHS